MTIDGVSAMALVLIASFAIDRIVNGSLFLLSFNQSWARRFPEPARLEDEAARLAADKKNKLIYFIFAGFLGIVVLAGCGGLRILTSMGIQPKWASASAQRERTVQPGTPPANAPAQATPPAAKAEIASEGDSSWGASLFSILDTVFTGLLLMGGADRIAQVIKIPGAPAERSDAKPIQITGKLVLEDPTGKGQALARGSEGDPI